MDAVYVVRLLYFKENFNGQPYLFVLLNYTACMYMCTMYLLFYIAIVIEALQ